MKKAFRYLLPLLLLMMLTLPALADSYEFADDLTGEYLYPAGSDESTATWSIRRRLPITKGTIAVQQQNDQKKERVQL